MENGEVRESSALESINLQTKYHCTASSFGFRSSIPPQPGSIGTNGVNRAASIPCYHFNRVKNGCDYETCTYIHVCAICGCDHGFYSCPRSDLCMEYTKTGACLDLNCKSRHWCILCHKMHPFGDPMCSLFSQLGCGDKHICLFCHSGSHGNRSCFHNLKVLINLEFRGSFDEERERYF
jgi:hypothetical protein